MANPDQAPLDLSIALLPIGAVQDIDRLEKLPFCFQRVDGRQRISQVRARFHSTSTPHDRNTTMRRGYRRAALASIRLFGILSVSPGDSSVDGSATQRGGRRSRHGSGATPNAAYAGSRLP